LIYATSADLKHVTIYNKDLVKEDSESVVDGAIFVLDIGDVINLHILHQLKAQVQIPLALNSVQEFKKKNRLQPTGLLLTIGERAVNLYNFDHSQNKEKRSCSLMSSLTFQTTTIVDSALNNQETLLCLQLADTRIQLISIGKLRKKYGGEDNL